MSRRVAMLPEGRRVLDLAIGDGVDDREGAVAAARNRDELRVTMVALADRMRGPDPSARDLAFQLLDALSRTGEPEDALEEPIAGPVVAVVAATIRPGRLRVAVVGAPVELLTADRRRPLHRVAAGGVAPDTPRPDGGAVRVRSITSAFGRGSTVAMAIGTVDEQTAVLHRPIGRCDCAELLRAIRHDERGLGAIAVARRW